MNVLALHRWHWILISLLLGALLGWIRSSYDEEIIKPPGYDSLPERPLEFERGLRQESSSKGAIHLPYAIYNIRVCRFRVGAKTEYIVKCLYLDMYPKRLSRQASGQLRAQPA